MTTTIADDETEAPVPVHLAVYDKESGEILRCVTCLSTFAALQAGPYEGWLSLIEPIATHRYRVNLDTLTLEALPEAEA